VGKSKGKQRNLDDANEKPTEIPYYFIANFAENYSFSFVFSLCLVNFSYRDASLC
jgi:hypothetical protein